MESFYTAHNTEHHHFYLIHLLNNFVSVFEAMYSGPYTQFFLGCRIVYTAETDTTDDKAIMVNGIYSKKPIIFKGHINRDFHNVNYDDRSNVEYDEFDDDERRQIVLNGDIV